MRVRGGRGERDGGEAETDRAEEEGEKTAGSTECFRFLFPVTDLSGLFLAETEEF